MRYNLKKKIIYSIIILALLFGMSYVAIFGMKDGYGSIGQIKQGLDLAGGVSITYEIQEDNPSDQDVSDTIYKLQQRVTNYSTEAEVYKEGGNRITVEIPDVTDANAILEELGQPGTLMFLDSDGYTKFSNGEECTPLLTGSDVKNAVAGADTSQSSTSKYVVSLEFNDEGKQKFASQIMTSKSPVRSAEDIDETALSYAEIKMLATGNPYIKEKMDLDIQVQKLKMLKSNFLSEKYGLEDKVIKFYPQQIAYLKSRVEGLTKDVETAKLHPKPIDEQPLGMMVSGVSYSEKAEAGQAIINACKSMNSPNAIPLGEYRGFQMELYFDTVQRNYVVKLKGETSRDVPLGDDAHGNIVRIDNGIERFEEALADTKNSLENTEKQFETAKQEIEKPFAKEEELRAKTARLDELNILLNMDKKENEIVGGEPDEGEAVGGRKEKSYER